MGIIFLKTPVFSQWVGGPNELKFWLVPFFDMGFQKNKHKKPKFEHRFFWIGPVSHWKTKIFSLDRKKWFSHIPGYQERLSVFLTIWKNIRNKAKYMKIGGYIANFLEFSKIFSFWKIIPVKSAWVALEGRKV